MDFTNFNALAFPDWTYRRGVASSHHLIPGEWREVHPFESAFRETDIDGLNLGVGRFQNSEDDESVYFGLKANGGPFWAEGGLASGYSGAPLVPFGRVGVDLNDRLSAFAAPAYNVDTQTLGAVLGLNVNALEW